MPTLDLDKFPQESGVYLMKDAKERVIYVGKAVNLRSRIKQYFIPGRDSRPLIPFLVESVAEIECLVTPNEKEALLLENTLIKKHQPKFNACLKDDKTFISLSLNHKHPWPRLKLSRHKKRAPAGELHFGPYTSGLAAKKTLELLQKLFPLRQCSDAELKRRKRPCLLYEMKRCIAPCVGKCSREEYHAFVEGSIDFLKGKDRGVVETLKAKMEKAAANLEFEAAGAFLQTIQQINHVTEGRSSLVTHKNSPDTDVISLYREGDELIMARLFFREGALIGSDHYSFSQVASSDEELLSSLLLQLYKSREDAWAHKLEVDQFGARPRSCHFCEEPIAARLWATNKSGKSAGRSPNCSPQVYEPLRKGGPKEVIVPCEPDPGLAELLSLTLVHPKGGEKKKMLALANQNAKALFVQEKNQQGIIERQLQELKEALGLDRYPEVIDCFDVSHTSGKDPVAAMCGFTGGRRDKNRTRLFKLKNTNPGDDYGGLREALSRYLSKAKESESLPDLLVIDGGKGQLGVALAVLEERGIVTLDVIALAKESGKHDKQLTREQVFLPHKSEPIVLEARSPLLFFLQRLRDETHSKVIRFHRDRRSKRLFPSEARR